MMQVLCGGRVVVASCFMPVEDGEPELFVLVVMVLLVCSRHAQLLPVVYRLGRDGILGPSLLFSCYVLLLESTDLPIADRSVLARRGVDTNLDASAPTFPQEYLASGAQQPDWVVTSPPYKGAINFVKGAMEVARYGVALKLPLSFMEPCGDRGVWLQRNPPSICVFLRRVRYTPAHVMVGEFWGVWYKAGVGERGTRLVYCT